MKKLYTIEVERCIDCHSLDFIDDNPNGKPSIKKLCIRADRLIDIDIYNDMPEWCPLEDVKE